MDQYIDSLNNLHIQNIENSFKSNLGEREWIEPIDLSQLKNNPKIVIEKADSGGAVTILAYRHYKQKI